MDRIRREIDEGKKLVKRAYWGTVSNYLLFCGTRCRECLRLGVETEKGVLDEACGSCGIARWCGKEFRSISKHGEEKTPFPGSAGGVLETEVRRLRPHFTPSCPPKPAQFSLSQCAHLQMMITHERHLHTHHQSAPSDHLPIVPWSPSRVLSSPPSSLPPSWNTWFVSLNRSEPQNPSLIPWMRTTQTTPSLSIPLTILAALERLYNGGLVQVNKLETFVIHVVGVEDYEIAYAAMAWEEILHQLPGVRELKLVLIGPRNVVSEETVRAGWIELECCPSCTRKGRSRVSRFAKTTWLDWFDSLSDVEKVEFDPNLIVGFNSGLHDVLLKEAWKPSLEVMLKEGFPCVFTSLSEQEGKDDAVVLEELGAKLLWRAEENVWRSEWSRLVLIFRDYF